MNLKRPNNFDSVAKFYDTLAGLVFGKSMLQAQTFYLADIPAGAKVLILGGGTGWLLKELIKINPTCSIRYIESSSKMLEHSMKNIQTSKQRIQFIHGTEACIPSDTRYDVVITNFFLDLFAAESCDKIIKKIKSSLRPESKWIVTDFVNLTWWHAAMLKAMYIFFRFTSGIEASELPQWTLLLQEHGMAVRKSKFFYGKFIKASIWDVKK